MEASHMQVVGRREGRTIKTEQWVQVISQVSHRQHRSNRWEMRQWDSWDMRHSVLKKKVLDVPSHRRVLVGSCTCSVFHLGTSRTLRSRLRRGRFRTAWNRLVMVIWLVRDPMHILYKGWDDFIQGSCSLTYGNIMMQNLLLITKFL